MLVALSGLGAAVDVNSLPRQVGSLNFKLPAFAEIHESADQSVPYVDRLTLYVSTFNPFAFLQVSRQSAPITEALNQLKFQMGVWITTV